MKMLSSTWQIFADSIMIKWLCIQIFPPQMSHHQDLNTFISEIENYDANMIIPANRQSHRNSTICQIIPIWFYFFYFLKLYLATPSVSGECGLHAHKGLTVQILAFWLFQTGSRNNISIAIMQFLTSYLVGNSLAAWQVFTIHYQ